MNNLRESWEFITIPARGSISVKHEVPRNKISDTGVQKGEVYKVSLTNKCLGTRWWAFGNLQELGEGTRFRQWGAHSEENEDGDEECEGEYQNGMWMFGEMPNDLALVPEIGEVEFEVM
jgi:hypothetical protein